MSKAEQENFKFNNNVPKQTKMDDYSDKQKSIYDMLEKEVNMGHGTPAIDLRHYLNIKYRNRNK